MNPCEPDPGVFDHVWEYRDGMWFCSACGSEDQWRDPPPLDNTDYIREIA